MSHVLAFVSGFCACFAWLLFEAFYGPIRLRRKPEPDEPGGGWDG